MVYKLHGGIDLHIHTTASDGMLSPTEVAAAAQRLHLEAFSITDHDTVAGVKEILSANLSPNLKSGPKFVPGIEISASAPEYFEYSGSLHLLGYGIDPYHRELNELLEVLYQSRENRTPQILDRLKQLGVPISMEEVCRQVGTSMIGRPHIAAVLVSNGYTDSVDDAFDRFLGKGRPAYVDKTRIPCHKVIATIKAAGGVAVLAHPFLISKNNQIISELIDLLTPMGLAGIECIYPEHPKEAVEFYRSLARRKNLITTGGTDFHGSKVRPGIEIGSGGGDFFVPFDLYQQLVTRLNANKNGDSRL